MDAAPLLITTRMCPLSFESRLFATPLQMLFSSHTHTHTHTHTRVLPRDGRSESPRHITNIWGIRGTEIFISAGLWKLLIWVLVRGCSYHPSIILIKVLLWLIWMFTVSDMHMAAVSSRSGKHVIAAKLKKCARSAEVMLKSVKLVWKVVWWGLCKERRGLGVSFPASLAGVFLPLPLSVSPSPPSSSVLTQSPVVLDCDEWTRGKRVQVHVQPWRRWFIWYQMSSHY